MELIEYLQHFNELLDQFLEGAGVWAPILCSLLIILEGILAFLPLFVFVTINVHTIGYFLGGSISWICTVIGSFLTFYMCRKGLSKIFYRKKRKHRFIKIVDKLKFSQIVLIISIPFAPSLFINVAAGLSHISIKKYFYALLVGKVCVIVFCSIMGLSMMECLTNPYALIKVVIIVLVGYVISRIVNKKFKLDERF